MDTDRINKFAQQAINKMDAGDFEGALKLTWEIKSMGPHYVVFYTASGLLIDIGAALGKEELIKQGVNLILKDLKQIVQDEGLASSAYYNLANGYMSLFSFKKMRNPHAACFKVTELDKAKAYYRKALEHDPKDPVQTSQTWVNLGSCLDQIGRVVEALECYEEALKLKPDHAMALANKGLALSYYARLSSKHHATFLIEAHSLLSQALKTGVTPESAPTFKGYLEQIREWFPDKSVLDDPPEYPGLKIKAKTKREKSLIEFCLKNKLYLNICNYCQKCSEAIGDPVVIESMIVPINKPGKEDFLQSDPFLRLSAYLNQIKQDYITTRFLLFLSKYKGLNLSFVDKRVKIIDTLDYSMHNIYIQLVKASFKSFYDVLDKIACFINEYLQLGIGETQTDFRRVWYSKPKTKKKTKKTKTVRTKIFDTKNHSLNALFDMHKDFENGPHRNLKNTRNALTHRFVNVRMFQGQEDEQNMSEETLSAQTLELGRLVRSAIIYLLQFVYMEEEKKRSRTKGLLPPLFTQEIPDRLKGDR